jgi:hypothetical protein
MITNSADHFAKSLSARGLSSQPRTLQLQHLALNNHTRTSRSLAEVSSKFLFDITCSPQYLTFDGMRCVSFAGKKMAASALPNSQVNTLRATPYSRTLGAPIAKRLHTKISCKTRVITRTATRRYIFARIRLKQTPWSISGSTHAAGNLKPLVANMMATNLCLVRAIAFIAENTLDVVARHCRLG